MADRADVVLADWVSLPRLLATPTPRGCLTAIAVSCCKDIRKLLFTIVVHSVDVAIGNVKLLFYLLLCISVLVIMHRSG